MHHPTPHIGATRAAGQHSFPNKERAKIMTGQERIRFVPLICISTYYPTDPLTIIEFRNPSHSVHKIRLSPDLEALTLGKGMSSSAAYLTAARFEAAILKIPQS